MKKAALLLLLISWIVGHSQTFEEYKKKRQDEIHEMKQNRQKALKNLKQEYDDYIKKRDEDFAAYLEQEWSSYKLYQAQNRRPESKPKKIPEFDLEQLSQQSADNENQEKEKNNPKTGLKSQVQQNVLSIAPKRLKPEEIIITEDSEGRSGEISPIVQKSVPENFQLQIIELNYYGRDLVFKIDPKLNEFRVHGLDESVLSSAWLKLSEMNLSSVVRKAQSYVDEMNLNSWAILRLYEELSAKITETDIEKAVLTWFFINRHGYDVHIAYAGEEISLLIPTTTPLYGIKYMALNGKKYYLTSKINSQQIYTYESSYPKAKQEIDLQIHRSMLLGNDLKKKKLTFNYSGETFTIPVVYNRSHIKFFQDYPVTDIEVYLNAPVSEALQTSLNFGLKNKVQEMDEGEGINFLLSLVQKAFKYKTDQDQFGTEKYFFPEEVFHFPFSDCEDRSAIFSYLVRKIMGVDVIGLDYPGHLATAVKLPQESGGYVTVEGARYIIADPTYVNAPFGVVMPKFSEAPVNVVYIKPDEMKLARNLWDKINRGGGYRGGIHQDYAFTTDGSCYLTGYYTDKLDLGDFKLSGNGRKQPFVALLNPEGEVQWLKGMVSEGLKSYAYANSLTLVNNTPVISGFYNGRLKIGKENIASDKDNLFLCKIPNRGSRWIKKIEIKEEFNNQRIVSSFSSSGQLLNTKYYSSEDAISTNEGLFYKNGRITLNKNLGGVLNVTEAYASGDDFDYAKILKNKRDELVSKNVEEAISGLFAVTSVIQNGLFIIPGTEAQKALVNTNPNFKKESPNIYQSIGTIDFLKYSDGIIVVNCKGDDEIVIDKLKIKNNARLKIVDLPDGNQRIEILSGFQVGKLFVWYDLNYVKMFRKSGDLLFDYGDDRTHKTFNLKKDILKVN